MSSRELHVWASGRHVGVFFENEDRISFSYDDSSSPDPPIGLSMPRSGQWTPDAPRNFLDNLLPDNPNVRQAMRASLHAESDSMFDLLDGVDATGGLVFSVSPEPPSENPVLRAISEDQIANEIDRIERTRNYWWDDEGHCRFSLGGAQGKFTMSRVDGHWFWPELALPSTHIVKPRPRDLPEAVDVELATMRLSALCGVETPQSGEIHAGNSSAYIVERFDRRIERGRIIRLRQEDLLQAMGLPTRDKYEPGADACLDLLQRVDPTGTLSYQWLERLAFNTWSGNSDAHAKNYSVLLDQSLGIRVAPQYDAVTTRYWPRFNWELAMPINEDHEFAEHTIPQDWEDLASRHGLDGEAVADMARRMAGLIIDNMAQACDGMDEGIRARLTACWMKTTESADPLPPDSSPMSMMESPVTFHPEVPGRAL
ncbi:HipA domain-containing protein [Bifidobacterium aerophilum]|nr:HipA domain-containing protein [Bifidobacterium aerophilum]